MIAAAEAEVPTLDRSEELVFPDAPTHASAVCAHAWVPFPSRINRFRRCATCGVINRYMITPEYRTQQTAEYDKDYYYEGGLGFVHPSLLDVPHAPAEALEGERLEQAVERFRRSVQRNPDVLHFLPVAERLAHQMRMVRDDGRRLHNFRGGIPLNRQVGDEHLQAFDEMGIDPRTLGRTVLEVGAGIGRVAPMYLRLGFEYEALEGSRWSSEYMANAYGVRTYTEPFETFDPGKKYDLVSCDHTLEHFPRADLALEKLASLVNDGGYLFILVPDNSDLYNPDHVWFFDEGVLKTWVEAAGLTIRGCVRKKISPLEDFIYLVAQKGA